MKLRPLLLCFPVGLLVLPLNAQPLATDQSEVKSATSNATDAERVRELIDGAVRRCQFVTPEGVHGMTFLPMATQDRNEILVMGTRAVSTLGDYTGDRNNSIAQLLAVRLLGDLGLPETFMPLERAVDPVMWQAVRISALYGLAKLDHRLIQPIVQRMTLDGDPKVREVSKAILQELH